MHPQNRGEPAGSTRKPIPSSQSRYYRHEIWAGAQRFIFNARSSTTARLSPRLSLSNLVCRRQRAYTVHRTENGPKGCSRRHARVTYRFQHPKVVPMEMERKIGSKISNSAKVCVVLWRKACAIAAVDHSRVCACVFQCVRYASLYHDDHLAQHKSCCIFCIPLSPYLLLARFPVARSITGDRSGSKTVLCRSCCSVQCVLNQEDTYVVNSKCTRALDTPLASQGL